MFTDTLWYIVWTNIVWQTFFYCFSLIKNRYLMTVWSNVRFFWRIQPVFSMLPVQETCFQLGGSHPRFVAHVQRLASAKRTAYLDEDVDASNSQIWRYSPSVPEKTPVCPLRQKCPENLAQCLGWTREQCGQKWGQGQQHVQHAKSTGTMFIAFDCIMIFRNQLHDDWFRWLMLHWP